MVIGEALVGDGNLFGDAANRQPLNPQVKANLLSQMPFVSEPVGDDISDLGDATPTGSSRKTRRILLGAGVGLAVGFALCRFAVNVRGKR